MAEQATMQKEVSNAYAIIGGLVSAGSLISLVQKLFSVGLSPVLYEFVAYYRRVAYFFVDWMTFWLPFQVPGWYKDAYIISVVCCATYMRAAVATKGGMSWASSLAANAIGVVGGLIASIVLSGFIFPLLAAAVLRSDRKDDDFGFREMLQLYIKMLVATCLATIAFFALNSQM